MILERKKDGEQLSTLECHDIVCHIADAVLSGGIRRAACISLFSMDDEEMLNCKTGNWWELNPQRGRANNSVSILRHRVKKVDFMNLWERIKASKAGEPGFYFTNNADWGINPCKPLESLILTKDGYITFEQALEYNELDVVLPSGEIVKATKPFKTGTNRSITKVSLSNGKYIYGTPNHKHMTNDGIWKEISEFEIGDKLEYSVINIHGDFNTIINQENYNKGLIAGWSVADGWFWKNEKGSHTYGICFGINEFDCVPLYESLLNMKVKPHQDKPDTCKLFTTKKLEFIEKIKEIGLTTEKTKIEWLYKKDKDFKLGFIRSIFTADGSVRHSNNVELYSIDRKMLEVVSNVLNEFGIYNTICIHNNERHYIAKDGKIRNNKITYKINVFSGQFKKIGFLSSFKQTRLDAHILKTPRNTTYVEVLDIVHEYKVEDVYDITVEHDSHSFVDTGITSHNCCEISLRSNQMCNLTTVNTSNIKDQDDLNERVAAASFIGTLQAAYTDFYYLRDIWKRTCEKEALIGVSLTGIASNEYLKCDLSQASEIVKNTNIRVAKLIGINPASRTTCVKPEGTASLVLGTSSGVHSWFAPYYIRRMKVGKNEALYTYLNSNIPELLEDDFFNPNKDAFVTIPIAAPEGAITSDVETPLQLLERIKYLSDNWIKPGHVKGDNTHNVSATVYIKPEEWDNVGEWMWNHRDSYNGLSVLDFDGGTYKQTPFERITKERYEEMSSFIKDIDLTNVLEGENNVDLKSEVACSSGVCELQF
jgi:ribonucleotide reductase alpha subunit